MLKWKTKEEGLKKKEKMLLIMVVFAFAKETLNLIDNLERSKLILENDEKLKNSEALKKNLRTF